MEQTERYAIVCGMSCLKQAVPNKNEAVPLCDDEIYVYLGSRAAIAIHTVLKVNDITAPSAPRLYPRRIKPVHDRSKLTQPPQPRPNSPNPVRLATNLSQIHYVLQS